MKAALVSFLMGVAVASGIYEIKKPKHTDLRRSVKAALFKPFQKDVSEDLTACAIPEVSQVPQGAIVFIGHAYGKPDDPEVFPEGRLANLLTQNKTNIRHVVFTGDVFAVPSKRRWQRLRDFFDDLDIGFSIAPGNHDVERGENPSRDVFMDEIGDPHLRSLVLSEEIIVLEDSIRNDWLVPENLVASIKELAEAHPSKKLLIARHNIPVEALAHLANSTAYKAAELPDAQDLAEMFGEHHVSIVSGDSGAFPRLPRSSCHSFENITFYTNGLGGLDNDEVLILHQGELSKLTL